MFRHIEVRDISKLWGGQISKHREFNMVIKPYVKKRIIAQAFFFKDLK